MFSRAALSWAPFTLALACGLSEYPVPDASLPVAGDPPAGGSGGSPAGAGGSGGSGGEVMRDAGPPQGGRGGTGVVDAAAPPSADAASATPPPPSAGVTVSINGTIVPKEKVLVFLHIGHSNMAGRVTTPISLRPFNFETHPQLWVYARGGMWRAAREPTSGDSMADDCGGVGCAGLPFGAGPGMSILRRALALVPDAHVVSIGVGRSGLSSGYCRSFRKGGLLYDLLMGPALELKGKVTFAGLWTMFGQSEVNDGANNGRFGDCMVGIINEIRTDLAEPDLPYLVGDWEAAVEGGLSATSRIGQIILPQMRAVPMRVSRSLLIPTEGLPLNPLDDQHFDLTGHKLWAERGFDLLVRRGWAPWAMPLR